MYVVHVAAHTYGEPYGSEGVIMVTPAYVYVRAPWEGAAGVI